MTLRITVPGAGFHANHVGRIQLTTYRTGLIGEYILGGSAAASIYNGANPDRPLVVKGEPTYGVGYCGLSQTSWFDTLLLDSQELTALVFCTAQSSTSMLFGNFTGGNIVDTVALYKNFTDFVVQSCATDATLQQIVSSVNNLTGADESFRGLAIRTTGGVSYTSKIDQFKAGVRAGGTATTHTGKTREVQSTPAFAIGSSRGHQSLSGAVNVAATLVWNQSLSDADLLAAYLEARAVLAARGITT